jgi:hypothetical protein
MFGNTVFPFPRAIDPQPATARTTMAASMLSENELLCQYLRAES